MQNFMLNQPYFPEVADFCYFCIITIQYPYTMLRQNEWCYSVHGLFDVVPYKYPGLYMYAIYVVLS